MALLPAGSIDAVVCDPPYGLEFMGKEWDRLGVPDGSPLWRHTGTPNFSNGSRSEAVVMQEWHERWAAEALRVLKPGGHLLAFGGTRTYHRLASGLEDAGFEIRDSLHWIYGSGFPKSLDVSKAIDKAAGAARTERAGPTYKVPNAREVNPHFIAIAERRGSGEPETIDYAKTVPASAEAAEWDGWGTALKPAHEPIVLARKPLDGTVAATVLKHGTGGLNVAAARVGDSGGIKTLERPPALKKTDDRGGTDFPPHATKIEHLDAGRWPSNVLLAHLPECKGNGASNTDVLCAPGCPVAELNEMSGESVTSPKKAGVYERDGRSGGMMGAKTKITRTRVADAPGDSGGAARFFYIAKPKTRERIGGTMRNLHPTVKPVALMRYLVRLATFPGGTVLDPFMGSGTTGCAAMAEGFGFIGIEMDQSSFDTARDRVGDWAFALGRSRPITSP